MKKRTCFLLGFILFFVIGFSISSFALCGDINYDGKVDIVDALLLAKALVIIYSDPIVFPFSSEIADVNDDGTINIVDALFIAQYYIGVRSTLNCPTPDLTPIPTPVPAQVWVSHIGGIQCQVSYYSSSIDAMNFLNSNGIYPIQLLVESVPVVALCGAFNGLTFRALINSSDLAKANANGWY